MRVYPSSGLFPIVAGALVHEDELFRAAAATHCSPERLAERPAQSSDLLGLLTLLDTPGFLWSQAVQSSLPSSYAWPNLCLLAGKRDLASVFKNDFYEVFLTLIEIQRLMNSCTLTAAWSKLNIITQFLSDLLPFFSNKTSQVE